jgi:hypothetical protein
VGEIIVGMGDGVVVGAGEDVIVGSAVLLAHPETIRARINAGAIQLNR